MRALALLLVPQLVSAAAIAERNFVSKAAYFINNDPAGNHIVSLEISPYDGTVSNPVQVATGGKGAIGLNAGKNGGPPTNDVGDVTFSQDSLVISGNYLFAVNPGSNTLSLFVINPFDITHPTLVGTPQDTLGEFPNSVAYSPRLNQACVVNSGAVAGVTCFEVDCNKGLKVIGGLRPIALGQTTPPIGPFTTVADIVFNPSETALIVTVKGTPLTTPVTDGLIYAYPVLFPQHVVSTTPVVTGNIGIVLDFSLTFLGTDSRAIITDPAYGASIIDFSPGNVVSVEKKIVVPGQGAICWSEWSPRFDTILLMDGGGSSNVTVIDPRSGDIRGAVVLKPVNVSSFDSQFLGQHFYILTGGPSIAVLDLAPTFWGALPKQIQNFDLSGLNLKSFIGMAVYPPNRY